MKNIVALSVLCVLAVVESASFIHAEELLQRNVRATADQIRQSMAPIRGPDVNPNMGASSSSSITNVHSISVPKNLSEGGPNLKLGQGLAVAIEIQGPTRGSKPTSNTFANTQMFNTDPNTDFGNASAQAGAAGHNIAGTKTGTAISMQGQRGPGSAGSFNQANMNAFRVGQPTGNRSSGTQFGGASAFGEVRPAGF